MKNRFQTIEQAATILDCAPDSVRSLARQRLVPTKIDEATGEMLVDVVETSVALGIDIGEDEEDIDQLDHATASLALLQRRIKLADLKLERERTAHREKLGQLVPIEEVRRTDLSKIRVVRTALLAMSQKLPIHLVEQPLAEIEKRIEAEALRIINMFRGEQDDE